MKLRADYSQAMDFQPPNPGTYPMRIMSCEVKTTKSGGQAVKWILKIFNSDDPSQNGKTISYFTSLSGKASFNLRQFLKSADESLDNVNFDTNDFLGKCIEVTFVINSVSGYPDVKKVYPYVVPGSLSDNFDAV